MATARQKERKKRELERLEVRLSKGLKPQRAESKHRDKGYTTLSTTIPMTDSDKKILSTTIHNLKVKLGLVAATAPAAA